MTASLDGDEAADEMGDAAAWLAPRVALGCGIRDGNTHDTPWLLVDALTLGTATIGAVGIRGRRFSMTRRIHAAVERSLSASPSGCVGVGWCLTSTPPVPIVVAMCAASGLIMT